METRRKIMNAISEKQKILALVQQTYDDLMTLAMGLSTEEKKSKGSLKLWSAKDMFAHLTFWENHFKNQLKKQATGEKIPNSGDYYDQVNDGVLYEHLDQPFEEALNEYQELHSELVKMYAQFSEEDLADLKKYDWLEGRSMTDRILGNSVWHPESHLADYLVKHGKLDQATRMQEALTEQLKSFSTWRATAMYNLACFYALNSMPEKAIPCLKEAFKGRPDLIEWSKQDTDLD
jgi:hypothetical protein